jgi:hypothetical protein
MKLRSQECEPLARAEEARTPAVFVDGSVGGVHFFASTVKLPRDITKQSKG